MAFQRLVVLFVSFGLLCDTVCHQDQFLIMNAKMNSMKLYLEMEINTIKADLQAMNLTNFSGICGYVATQCAPSGRSMVEGQGQSQVQGQDPDSEGHLELKIDQLTKQLQDSKQDVQTLQRGVAREKQLRVKSERQMKLFLARMKHETATVVTTMNNKTKEILVGFEERINFFDGKIDDVRQMVDAGNANHLTLEQKFNDVSEFIQSGWAEWSSWGSCSATCGGGLKQRERTCNDTVQAFGTKCTGGFFSSTNVMMQEEVMECSQVDCPVSPQWTPWSAWSPCYCSSPTNNLQHRHRLCLSEGNSSSTCPGSSTEQQSCSSTCSSSAGWTLWSSWGQCYCSSLTASYQTRVRSCVPGQDGSTYCYGSSQESQSCSSSTCSSSAQWTSWSDWGPCYCYTLSSDYKHRIRTCVPGHDGSTYCPGESKESSSCSSVSCDTSAHWAQWSDWSPCYCYSTSSDKKHRIRACIPGTDGSTTCSGASKEMGDCTSVGCD